jgi:hypothetical protein
LTAAVWPTPALDPVFELMWVKVVQGSDVTLVGALYHPPSPLYQPTQLLDHIETAVMRIQTDFPDAHIILAGDLNALSDSEVVIRTGLTSIVSQPTRGNNLLDRVYVSDQQYSGVKVVKSSVKSDHQVIVVYSGDVMATVEKTRRVCTFRKHTPAQHAHFLASVSDMAPMHVVNLDSHGDPQEEYDRLYTMLTELLDAYYPVRSVTITSADSPYVTPTVKYMLRRKNKLMRSGKIEQAAALAVKIGDTIKKFNSAELGRVDVLSDAGNIWAKVRQLT